MPQDEDLPLTRRQRVDRLQEPAAELATLLALRGGLAGRGQGGGDPPRPPVPVVVQGILRHGAPVPDPVDAMIGQDAGGPGERMRAGAIALPCQVDLHVGLLHRVESVLVIAQVADGHAVQPALVTLDEGLEGAGSSALDAVHEGEVIRLHTPSVMDPTFAAAPGFTAIAAPR